MSEFYVHICIVSSFAVVYMYILGSLCIVYTFVCVLAYICLWSQARFLFLLLCMHTRATRVKMYSDMYFLVILSAVFVISYCLFSHLCSFQTSSFKIRHLSMFANISPRTQLINIVTVIVCKIFMYECRDVCVNLCTCFLLYLDTYVHVSISCICTCLFKCIVNA